MNHYGNKRIIFRLLINSFETHSILLSFLHWSHEAPSWHHVASGPATAEPRLLTIASGIFFYFSLFLHNFFLQIEFLLFFRNFSYIYIRFNRPREEIFCYIRDIYGVYSDRGRSFRFFFKISIENIGKWSENGFL